MITLAYRYRYRKGYSQYMRYIVPMIVGLLIIVAGFYFLMPKEERPKIIKPKEILLFQTERLIELFPESNSKSYAIEISNVSNISKIKVVIDAEVTNADEAKNRDGVAVLLVKLNDYYPYDGQFGYTQVIDDFLQGLMQNMTQEQRDWFEENVVKVVNRSLIYAPFPIGIGNAGARELYFNQTAMKEGINTLTITNLDQCTGSKDCDGFWVYSVKVYAIPA